MFIRGRFGVSGPLDPDDRFALRNWWHELLRGYDRYYSYGIFLLLPGDQELIRYLTDFSQELNSLSGENCLVLAVGGTGLQRSNVDEIFQEEEMPPASSESIWQEVMRDQIRGGYSLKFAELFDVRYTDLPCLILFQKFQGADHLIVSLREMNTEEILLRMRSIFFTIQQAAVKAENPLTAVERQLFHESVDQKEQKILNGLRVLANKTLQTTLEAWIKTMVGK